MSALSFAHVHATARRLTLETLGAERDPEALAALTGELFDFLPEDRQAELWRGLGRAFDDHNTFLNEGVSKPRRQPSPASNVQYLRSPVEDPLRAVPLPVAIEILTGVEVPRSRMIRCPLPDHEDRTPSCKVADEFFYCHGCGIGGDVYVLASQLFGLGTRGADFLELRRRLALALLGSEEVAA